MEISTLKKTMAILPAVLFLVTVTVGAESAERGNILTTGEKSIKVLTILP